MDQRNARSVIVYNPTLEGSESEHVKMLLVEGQNITHKATAANLLSKRHKVTVAVATAWVICVAPLHKDDVHVWESR